MKSRTFNSLMHLVNEKWAEYALNMNLNPNKGPDLIDEDKAVEIKFKLLSFDGKYTHKCWKVLGHQLEYNKKYPEIYWGLGFYKLDKEIKKIKVNELEKMSKDREIYLVNWEWMNQFPEYHHKGKTILSEWDQYVLFPKFSLIPKVISEKNVEGGKIFFTEGVNPEKFNISPKITHQNPYKDTPF